MTEHEHEVFALLRNGVPLTLLIDLALGVPELPVVDAELSWAS